MKKILNIGLDIGSTTVKIVAMDQRKNIVYSDYRRHYSDTKKTVKDLLNEFLRKYNNYTYTITLTGSEAIALSKYIKVNFVCSNYRCCNRIRWRRC